MLQVLASCRIRFSSASCYFAKEVRSCYFQILECNGSWLTHSWPSSSSHNLGPFLDEGLFYRSVYWYRSSGQYGWSRIGHFRKCCIAIDHFIYNECESAVHLFVRRATQWFEKLKRESVLFVYNKQLRRRKKISDKQLG